MGFFDKLLKKKEKKQEAPAMSGKSPEEIMEAYNSIIAKQQQDFASQAAAKSAVTRVPEKMLMGIFITYFAPNKDFYMDPDSPKHAAYFGALKAAELEMLNNEELLKDATKWTSTEVMQLMNDPIPGISNSIMCGLIFLTGQFAVIRQGMYCVDFSERIPYCIALYLLLIAERQPEDQRKQAIDAGEGTDKKRLSDAMGSLKVCDPKWEYKIC